MHAPEALEQFLEAIKQRVVDLQAIVTGQEGPLERRQLEALQASRAGAAAASDEAAKAGKPGGDASFGERSGKPAGASTAGGAAAGSSVSPGSMGDSRAPGRSSVFRPDGSGMQSAGASGMSGGPLSKKEPPMA